jgi:hypothetical protein
MTRLRRVALPLLAAVCLGGLPACGKDDVKREATKAKNEAKKKAKHAADKTRKATNGY